ncbi:hypothetical protein GCM10027416_31200 [Okibacterium endophyticum]
MTAPPGWYEAGASGRLRWWDGQQWTGHEAAAPAAVSGSPLSGVPLSLSPVASPQITEPRLGQHSIAQPTVGASVAASVARPASATVSPTASALPHPGWYADPNGRIRWWSARYWTGFTLKDGRPATDGYVTEQPSIAWASGFVFLMLAGAQFGLSVLAPVSAVSGAAMLILAALWFTLAARTASLRKLAAPVTAPVPTDVVRPLPGEREAAGANWYPVTAQASRWWTGTRWAAYVWSQSGVTPTFHGQRMVAMLRLTGWIFLGIGVAGVIGGILALVVEAGSPTPWPLSGIGAIALIAGLAFAIVSPVALALARTHARMLLIPAGPPVPPPGFPIPHR